MDEDNAELTFRLGRPLGRYGELYPDFEDRLRTILASTDPKMRRRAAQLAELLVHRSEERRGQLMERYGLTSAEARVAAHLADGGTIASCAAAAALSQGTVRVQLKAVFAKTGVNRQAALVKLLQEPF